MGAAAEMRELILDGSRCSGADIAYWGSQNWPGTDSERVRNDPKKYIMTTLKLRSDVLGSRCKTAVLR